MRTVRGFRSVATIAWGLSISFACSSTSTVEPPLSLPSALVTNKTCEWGRCTTLEIRAFISKVTIPQLPQGYEVLGEAPPGQTCLTFPSSWSFAVIGPGPTGGAD